jgi:hypothetical protein
MANYKGIHGGTVQNFAGDPGNAINGQVWYDKAAAAFQYAKVTTAASWSTGGNLNTARGYITGFGNQTAALAASGINTSNTTIAITEQYNGSSWTEVNDQNTTAQGRAGGGTTTSAVICGGRLGPPGYTGNSEEWNGTSWSEGNDLNGGRNTHAGTGVSSDAAIVTQGSNPGSYPPRGQTGATEVYDGTSWTEVNDLNQERSSGSTSGTSTAALTISGIHPGLSPVTRAETESWNGTSWTEVNDMNSGRYSTAAFGTTTATIAGGGSPPDTATETESWNGTSWTEVNDLNVGRYRVGYGPTGTSTSGICIGGRTDAYVANVEHWSGAGTTAFTVSTT